MDQMQSPNVEIKCCIVGAGPAGAMLALLLARQHIPVLLLEEHQDFDRDFRGDTIHPAVLDILSDLGLADQVLALANSRIHKMIIPTVNGQITLANFDWLKIKYPFIALVPQTDFLDYMTKEASRYPDFHILMGARVEGLITDGDEVKGVRYRNDGQMHEVHVPLTIGADGRFSRVRNLAGFAGRKTSPPMDILWFRLPRKEGDPEAASVHFNEGHMLILLDRGANWQIGYVIPKGSYKDIHETGIEELHKNITTLVPELADRVYLLASWKDVSMLSVESSMLKRWYKPGLLLIGDAAHVMSPAGGVGINYAIQDAVAAANILATPLQEGNVSTTDLAKVQRARKLPTQVIQIFQTFIQKMIMEKSLKSEKHFSVPLLQRIFLTIPWLRTLPAWLIAYGIFPARLRQIKR